MNEHQRSSLRRCGGLWKPRPGSQSLGSGSITVGELKQRFIVVRNEKKAKPEQPDYLLMATAEPELDTFARDHQTMSRVRSAPPRPAGPAPEGVSV